MANYSYKAKSADGRDVKGKMEANDQQQLISLLREKGLFLLSFKKENAMNKDIDLSFMQRVTLKDLAIFTRQFSSMITAGLTVVDAIDIMRSQTQNKKLRDALETISEEVKKGSSLSSGLKVFPKIFPEILINMVEAGELSGKLDVSLERASDHFDKESALNGKVRGAMTYPLVVCIVAFIAIAFLVAVVIPGFMTVFTETNTELPFTTKTLLGLSMAFRKYWYFLIIAIFGMMFAYRFYYHTPDGHEKIDWLKLKIPVFGPLNEKIIASRFSRTLATMMESGLPLLTSLEITARVVDNYFIGKRIIKVREEVSHGSNLADPLENTNVFPKMITHMVAVGEKTGEIESLLMKAAVFYDEEVDLGVKQLTTALEPMIIILLGGVVTFIVLSILQPMFAMYQGVSNM